MSKPKVDLVPSELRRIEQKIDDAYKSNSLIGEPFTRAAWHFLAYCESSYISSILHQHANDPFSRYDNQAIVHNIATHSRWPLYWMLKSCRGEGRIPSTSTEEMYASAYQLSSLSSDYGAFESAYTYATIGSINLSLEGTTIISDSILRDDMRYQAYDLCATDEVYDRTATADSGIKLDSQLSKVLKISGMRFKYRLHPRIMKLAIAHVENIPMGAGPKLPTTWRFSRYSVDDFQRWAQVLRGLCFLHHIARIRSIQMTGLPHLGYANSLITMSKREMRKLFVRYTGLSQGTIKALFEDFTYGSRNMQFPDPILQPLIPLLPNRYGVAPHLILSSSMERNFAVLMNRIPEERKIYNGLSGEREEISRKRIVSALSSLPIRHWHGNVPGWNQAREIDLAIIEESSKCCLILELKSFVAPDEIREIWDRSKEIKKGSNRCGYGGNLQRQKGQVSSKF